ncbi:hypothetical protein DPX16_15605 [Anabarilius grahami]|uniref:Chromo domain-containing protein n=1 Tax=Anabarilius grahami TaxID=495550 RepID=A0A3N0Z6A9_ANAGA|nr:hypothetical protein DPX16_15605 [Anabarilius grahami]
MSQSDPFQDLVDAFRRTFNVQPPSHAPPPAPASIITSASTVTSPSLPVYTSPMAKPAPYSGSAEDCNGFLLQVSLTLEMQPHLFPTDYSKSPRFIGPFTITEQVNPVTYKLQLPPEYRIHPTFHVSLLKPHHPSVPLPTEPGVTEAEPPLPLILEDGAAYEVRDILDSRRRGGQFEYLMDWEGYGPEERSWVPRNDILDPNLLDTFHSTHPNRPAPATTSGSVGGWGGVSCHRHARLQHPPITVHTIPGILITVTCTSLGRSSPALLKTHSHTVTLSGLVCIKGLT